MCGSGERGRASCRYLGAVWSAICEQLMEPVTCSSVNIPPEFFNGGVRVRALGLLSSLFFAAGALSSVAYGVSRVSDAHLYVSYLALSTDAGDFVIEVSPPIYSGFRYSTERPSGVEAGWSILYNRFPGYSVRLSFPARMLPVLFVMVGGGLAVWRSRTSFDLLRCNHCGYDLIGSDSALCPECGQLTLQAV